MTAAALLQGLIPVLSILLLRLRGDHIASSWRAVVFLWVVFNALWTLRQVFLAQLAVYFHFLPTLFIHKFTAALEGRVHIVHIVRRFHWIFQLRVHIIFTWNSFRLTKAWRGLQSFGALLFVRDGRMLLNTGVRFEAPTLGSIPRLLLISFVSLILNTLLPTTFLFALRRQHRLLKLLCFKLIDCL